MRPRPPRRLRAWPGWLGLLSSPATAQAHSPVPGAGDFISGLLHPLTTPTHVLLIVGLGLVAGRRPLAELKMPMAVFAALAALALTLTATGWIKSVYPPVLIAIALVAAALLALEKMLTPAALSALFAAAALALGLDSAVETGSTTTRIKTLLGNGLSLIVLVADLAIYVSLAGEAKWLKIALRIAGSWILAIGLLVLAFSLRRS